MITNTSTILLIENDVHAAVRTLDGLRSEGYRTLHAQEGHQGLKWTRAAQPDLVLLDVLLPQGDGFAVCHSLRQASVVPIIMLGHSDQEADKIKGLETGADDYVVKPISFRELMARIRALLRRRELDRRQIAPQQDRIVAGEMILDRSTQQVWQRGELIEMPQREFDLLRVLMEHAGQAVPRQELLDRVWGQGWVGYPRTLNVHIYRLRQKLEEEPAVPRLIETVRSYGYHFVEPNA